MPFITLKSELQKSRVTPGVLACALGNTVIAVAFYNQPRTCERNCSNVHGTLTHFSPCIGPVSPGSSVAKCPLSKFCICLLPGGLLSVPLQTKVGVVRSTGRSCTATRVRGLSPVLLVSPDRWFPSSSTSRVFQISCALFLSQEGGWVDR